MALHWHHYLSPVLYSHVFTFWLFFISLLLPIWHYWRLLILISWCLSCHLLILIVLTHVASCSASFVILQDLSDLASVYLTNLVEFPASWIAPTIGWVPMDLMCVSTVITASKIFSSVYFCSISCIAFCSCFLIAQKCVLLFVTLMIAF